MADGAHLVLELAPEDKDFLLHLLTLARMWIMYEEVNPCEESLGRLDAFADRLAGRSLHPGDYLKQS